MVRPGVKSGFCSQATGRGPQGSRCQTFELTWPSTQPTLPPSHFWRCADAQADPFSAVYGGGDGVVGRARPGGLDRTHPVKRVVNSTVVASSVAVCSPPCSTASTADAAKA